MYPKYGPVGSGTIVIVRINNAIPSRSKIWFGKVEVLLLALNSTNKIAGIYRDLVRSKSGENDVLVNTNGYYCSVTRQFIYLPVISTATLAPAYILKRSGTIIQIFGRSITNINDLTCLFGDKYYLLMLETKCWINVWCSTPCYR